MLEAQVEAMADTESRMLLKTIGSACRIGLRLTARLEFDVLLGSELEDRR